MNVNRRSPTETLIGHFDYLLTALNGSFGEKSLKLPVFSRFFLFSKVCANIAGSKMVLNERYNGTRNQTRNSSFNTRTSQLNGNSLNDSSDDEPYDHGLFFFR